MIINRKVLIVPAFMVVLAAGSDAAAGTALKTGVPGCAAERVRGILKALSGGVGGQDGASRMFDGLAAEERGRVVKTAAGDGDVGWPPENPFGKQKPTRPDPPPQKPPREEPPPQKPPRETKPEIPALPPSTLPGTTRPTK